MNITIIDRVGIKHIIKNISSFEFNAKKMNANIKTFEGDSYSFKKIQGFAEDMTT